MTLDVKACTKCGEVKPLSEYYKCNQASDGLTRACKNCTNAYNNARYEQSEEFALARRASAKKYYHKNREKCLAQSKARHKIHKAKDNAYRKQWYDANKTEVLAGVKTRRLAHIAAGVCADCGEPTIDESRYCEQDHIRHAAHQRLGSGCKDIRDALMLKMREQNYTCPYTGRRLVYGGNASLDHVKSIASFPKGSKQLAHELDNVVWADVNANIAKHSLSLEEFIQLCRAVVSTADKKVVDSAPKVVVS